MKNRILASLFVVLFLCRCTSQMDVNNDDNSLNFKNILIVNSGSCLPDVADKYKYPIVPGTEEWKNLGSHEGAVRVCQLPADVLKQTSTLGLIRSFLDAPLLSGSYYVSSNTSSITRMHSIYPSYNSIEELFGRKDAGDALLLYYDAICFDCLETMTVSELMLFNVQVIAVEILFTQQKILDQLNYKDKQKVVAILLDKYEQMLKLNNEDFQWSIASIDVMANLMYASNYKPIVDYFSSENKPLSVGVDTVSYVISFAKQFIH